MDFTNFNLHQILIITTIVLVLIGFKQIQSIVRHIDEIKNIPKLIAKLDLLIDKIEAINLTQNTLRTQLDLETENIKSRIDRLEKYGCSQRAKHIDQINKEFKNG